MRTLRRRMMASRELPSNYERLEYIENTSTAYINTGIDASHFDKVYCKMIRVAIVGRWDTIWGTRITSYTEARSLIVTNTNKFWLNHGSYDNISTIPCVLGKMYETLYNNGTYTINGKTETVGSGNPQNTNPCYIFVGNSSLSNLPGSIGNYYVKAKIFDFKMYKGETILLSLIPVKRKSDGVIGMYDLVGRKFYTSPNGVAFTGG